LIAARHCHFGPGERAGFDLPNLSGRDGGYVVIGIDDANPSAMLPGLDNDQLASWLKFDDNAAKWLG
jgi:hypothetical protein